jgi:hypothetical protein
MENSRWIPNYSKHKNSDERTFKTAAYYTSVGFLRSREV